MKIRQIVALALVLLVVGTGWKQMEKPASYVIEPESRLWIEGTSSLHDWTCEAENINGTFEADAAPMTVPFVSNVEVQVPVTGIECKNGTMNKKVRKALDADAYPYIAYVLETATVSRGASEAAFALQTQGRLTLAGAEKPLTMTVQGTALAEGKMRFTGSTPLLMTDFGIDPPTALLGTLKTGDRIVVHFDVVVAPMTRADVAIPSEGS